MTETTQTTPGCPDDSPTPFNDLDRYVALPRMSGLVLNGDGTRLVTCVSTLNSRRNGYESALWEIDPVGGAPAHRLTSGEDVQVAEAFCPDGSLLLRSSRSAPGQKEQKDAGPHVWELPARGGEARIVSRLPGGVRGVAVARQAGTVALVTPLLPTSGDLQEDAERRKTRTDGKVTAILHESYPIRYWDKNLGPEQNRLFVGSLQPEPAPGPTGPDQDEPADRLLLRELATEATDDVLSRAEIDITPDGETVLTTWRPTERGVQRSIVMQVDTRSGERRALLDDPDHEYCQPVLSPDGTKALVVSVLLPTPDKVLDQNLVMVDLRTGDVTELTSQWDLWPNQALWDPQGRWVMVTADEQGAAPLFRIDLDSQEVTRVTGDRGAYCSPQISPDGRWVYALRSSVDSPPRPVRVPAEAQDADPEFLPGPTGATELPGRLSEVSAVAEDGTPLRAWLVLPSQAHQDDPVPLLLWVHGGPVASWNDWSWRWNPWIMAAHGYAVLLPDPGLSTGYGRDFVARGWGWWGNEPYTDVMKITDAAVELPQIDQGRVAMMGGSFGGYMANWIAGHTDRFRGIVSHAGLWSLDQFAWTTDATWYWNMELSSQAVVEHSPDAFRDRIRTPMLLVHGERDYRVPISEGIRAWSELTFDVDGTDMPHKFLYFPDENHWILTPEGAKVWYRTVLAFLATTVHGEPWEVPEILK